jgi:hypothetical protein
MDYLKNFNQEMQLQSLLGEAKVLLKEKGELKEEKKEDLYKILQQVDYLLGKKDDAYEKFSEVFSSMADFDFSKRLSFNEDGGDDFENFIVNGINILNEELESEAVRKKIFHDFFDSLNLKDTLVIITDPYGFISFANSSCNQIQNFNDKALAYQSVNVLFEDFSEIEKFIKERNSFSDIQTIFKWKGNDFPVKVNVTISNSMGKIESLIYVVKLLE